MAKLQLSIAIGPYDRMRPLVDGEVQIDAVDPQFMLLEPEEIFFRAFRHEAFDICELSLSSYAVRVAKGDSPYIAVPVFPSRAFRHTCIVVRTDRGIATPADLRGRRIGIPEYQLTANVWARAILEEEYGVRPAEITWVRGGYDTPGRVEKISLNLPPGVVIENAPEGATISGMLAAGELDGVMGPRAPSCFERGDPKIDWLFPDPTATARDWFAKTRIFPVMHVLGIRRSLAERHPWLPGAVQKAFERSKAVALAKLADTSATKVTLPFVEENLRAARRLMGEDFFSYGLAANRHVFEWFLRHHHAQGLSSRLLAPEELFHPATLEAHKI
ncbi:PhnD/SsuA/transferrin family substrate-binding protein [Falsiroseomonas selenitidurans]|uniref:ABC transporter substrate-binding protein n=1 Tax=Falsiroseomonas selenitidurans TaxID=2716335 RepID=A0ABX1DYV5_9PROT|nr:PhnD/SsuA/transferrin family substrate-binding protein [Falsiroseomonas selenitidurans]NKC30089.1 ABC transporter substrate-binding protein [Falsiroseomonas selenitidurans]